MNGFAGSLRATRFLLPLLLVPVLVATAGTLPPGFQESVVYSGLTEPTAVRFASDGRVFVAEKSGIIKVFPDLRTNVPTVVADLRTNVHNYWDRGLLGLVLDPNFPANPYIYVLYAYDAVPGGTAPRWGTPGTTSDGCPTPPGPTTDGCVIQARLSRLQLSGNVMVGSEQVLVEGWCQQFPSHSIGALAFGPDGALYASAGEGADWHTADYGQLGGSLPGTPTVRNPCGDPPGMYGGAMTPPRAEGGALRSQSLHRAAGEPVVLSGTIVRVNPVTGAALPDNPLASDPDPNAARIVAYGLRSPFRFAIRPGTREIWIGDVGWNDWEEIDVVVDPTTSPVNNFGWPCYEGNGRQSSYDAVGLNLCQALYSTPNSVTAPYYTYNHSQQVVSGDTCPVGSSAIAGLAFQTYAGGSYPSDYNNALYFADYSRNCIWAMVSDANGVPSPGLVRAFLSGAASPVDVEFGPGGDLFYVDFDGGTVRRIGYSGAPGAPINVVARAGGPSIMQAKVSFTPPASNGGASITGYTVISSPSGGIDINAGSVATVHAIRGLTYGTSYTFRVTATNAIGTSIPSDASNSVTPSGLPIIITPMGTASPTSNDDCVEGRTWGFDRDNNAIWVSRGCRAEFRVARR